jgi:hypothetical protein
MARSALLLGVSEYFSLAPLPCAKKDVLEMEQVLLTGGFLRENIARVINPDLHTMQVESQNLFSNRGRDDLVLFYFSGHGMQDKLGKQCYLAARNTTDQRLAATATLPDFINTCIEECDAKEYVIILDCCFSGVFGKNLKFNRGKAVVLTASGRDYAKVEDNLSCSPYTYYLTEGIKAGKKKAWELNEYVNQHHIKGIKPEIFPFKDGFNIELVEGTELPKSVEILKLLMGCPSMTNRPRREAIVKELSLAIQVHDQVNADIENLIRLCPPRSECFKNLLLLLDFFDGDTGQFQSLMDAVG